MTKQLYTYTFVYSSQDHKTKFTLGYCWAHSKQEVRGIIQEQFEKYQAREMLGHNILEIDIATETTTTPRYEFNLPNRLDL